MIDFSTRYFGENTLLIEGPKVIDQKVNKKLVQIKNNIEAKYGNQAEVVCTYSSAAIYASKETLKSVASDLAKDLLNQKSEGHKESRTVHIPVCYEQEFALDIEHVAEKNKLPIEEVISKHIAVKYYVYFIGFLPGFPYLGGLNSEIATPRRSTPRQKINAGAVGIANEQTGVYPSSSPGGWNIIGQTPIILFDNYTGATLRAGDFVKFYSVSKEEYDKTQEQINMNTFDLSITYD